MMSRHTGTGTNDKIFIFLTIHCLSSPSLAQEAQERQRSALSWESPLLQFTVFSHHLLVVCVTLHLTPKGRV
jgi:hypothetical protein